MSDSLKPKVYQKTKGVYVFKKTFCKVFTSLLEIDFEERLAGVDKRLHPFIKKEFLVSEMRTILPSGEKGKVEYVYLKCVQSLIILEDQLTHNKRWFKCLVIFTPFGISSGYNQTAVLFVYLGPEHISKFQEAFLKLTK